MLKVVFMLLRDTIRKWLDDGAPRLAAALAYYTGFSIAPLLLVVTGLAGYLYEGAEQDILREVTELVPAGGGEAVVELVEGAQARRNTSAVASVVGLATLLLGGAGLFLQLQNALNVVWKVEPDPDNPVLGLLKKRFFSFTMVVGTAFLLLVSLILSTALHAFLDRIQAMMPAIAVIWLVVDFLLSISLATLIFALIFRLVPDAEVAWRDVGIGAVVTALLFTAGQTALSAYLGDPARLSVYGAFASLIVFLLWVYYSAQILLLGAEFTQVYSGWRRGKRAGDEPTVAPSPHARPAPGRHA